MIKKRPAFSTLVIAVLLLVVGLIIAFIYRDNIAIYLNKMAISLSNTGSNTFK